MSQHERVDALIGRRIIDALLISGRLRVDAELPEIEKALDKLFHDISEGDLYHLRNRGIPFPTVHEAVVGLLEAFADDVLGRVN